MAGFVKKSTEPANVTGGIPGLEIRVFRSASVRRADKDNAPIRRSYVYAVDNRFPKGSDFQSG